MILYWYIIDYTIITPNSTNHLLDTSVVKIWQYFAQCNIMRTFVFAGNHICEYLTTASPSFESQKPET